MNKNTPIKSRKPEYQKIEEEDLFKLRERIVFQIRMLTMVENDKINKDDEDEKSEGSLSYHIRNIYQPIINQYKKDLEELDLSHPEILIDVNRLKEIEEEKEHEKIKKSIEDGSSCLWR